MTHDEGLVRALVLPVKAVREACGISAIHSMRPSRRLAPKLDEVATMHDFKSYRRDLGIDKRKGDGIVIGVVDSGVNGTHVGFGNRLIECWDQTVKGKGAGAFEYGALLKPAQSIDRTGHGTPSPESPPGTINGSVALRPRARIIAIRTDFTQARVQDGITYVFQRAKELNCPAVVNRACGARRSATTEPMTSTLTSASRAAGPHRRCGRRK